MKALPPERTQRLHGLGGGDDHVLIVCGDVIGRDDDPLPSRDRLVDGGLGPVVGGDRDLVGAGQGPVGEPGEGSALLVASVEVVDGGEVVEADVGTLHERRL
jgi:hypothetical protein